MWVVVVAAGRGQRFGAPKQFERLAGARVVDHSIAAARSAVASAGSGGVVLVLPAGHGAGHEPGADVVVEGGETRSASVRAGLAAVPAEAEVVLVHDAARPLASPDLFAKVVEAVVGGADAVVPAVPVADTLRARGGGTVDRDGLLAVQTPQGFRAEALRRAHATGADSTDDATLVEDAGGEVVVVEGEPANRKITGPDDLVVAEALLARAAGAERSTT